MIPPIKTILVPVDFSEPSKKAVRYGLALADRFNARLVLAHIVPESALAYAFPVETFEIEKEQFERAKHEIQHLAPPKRVANSIVKVGAVEAELMGIIQDASPDLVVMGTHGRRRLRRWFIGSVAEHMLRHIPVPVLTVAHVDTEKHPITPGALTRMLYATDLSKTSQGGLSYAVDVARAVGAHLTVMHVLDDEDRMFWGPALVSYYDREKIAKELRQKLSAFVAGVNTRGVDVEIFLAEGKPFKQILVAAEERNVDLVVLSLESKALIERALLGATAERVIRLSTIPVLSIPTPEQTK